MRPRPVGRGRAAGLPSDYLCVCVCVCVFGGLPILLVGGGV